MPPSGIRLRLFVHMPQALRTAIWWIGAVVWLADSFLSLHYLNRGHALLALLLAIVFAVMGIYSRERPKK